MPEGFANPGLPCLDGCHAWMAACVGLACEIPNSESRPELPQLVIRSHGQAGDQLRQDKNLLVV